jgi:hypothetical protein
VGKNVAAPSVGADVDDSVVNEPVLPLMGLLTMPVAVNDPVTVAFAIVGEFERTTEPVPVEVVAPVPPFAAVSGFCSVRLLNVGDGNVWASAIAGTKSAVSKSFFILALRDRDNARVIPRDTSGGGFGGGKAEKNNLNKVR